MKLQFKYFCYRPLLFGFQNPLENSFRNENFLRCLPYYELHHRNFKNKPPPGGLEPPTFRLTAERASQLRHGGLRQSQIIFKEHFF